MEQIKSLFMSDFHLGSMKSQPKKIFEVLNQYKYENLFLIGDTLDIKKYWRKSCNQVVLVILKSGANIYYIPGNHDSYMRNFNGTSIGNIRISDKFIYTDMKGRRILICHGDQFDGFVKVHPFLYKFGDKLYELSMRVNKIFNWFRMLFGYEYWSLSAWLKQNVKKGLVFLNDFKDVAIQEVEKQDCDGIMIGHLHTPEVASYSRPRKWVDISKKQKTSAIEYYNTGDFCESCSYVIEDLNGNFELRYIK